jgi:hypothetical protein
MKLKTNLSVQFTRSDQSSRARVIDSDIVEVIYYISASAQAHRLSNGYRESLEEDLEGRLIGKFLSTR